WEEEQAVLLAEAQQKAATLAGDGRADSPRFSAKFGTYTLLDVEQNKILHFEVVQSNETSGSCQMERRGLELALTYLESHGIKFEGMVTDRHSQIKSFFEKERSDTKHEFDVWHVAKGVYRKLQTAAKKAGQEELEPRNQSINNHLYWSAASSNGHKELIVPKWTSLLNHIRNVHTHEEQLFPVCLHGDAHPIQWLQSGPDLQHFIIMRTAKEDKHAQQTVWLGGM
ncbi:uncharacterized protein LOC144119805, partial [Amblyomma americanum]